MIQYKRTYIDNIEESRHVLEALLELSKEWAMEKSSPAYYENEVEEYLDKEIFIALDGDKIVAYAMGVIKELEEKTSYNQIGDIAFCIDEFFVTKKYRNQGIGRMLYQFVEEELGCEVDLISLSATSYRYKDLLKFYIDDLGMEFNHAFLTKKMDNVLDN
ncbi:MAG: GNAT family N-acetyltransferase [Solobacterium sp.]|nr:GNAT family N-acetyltransferase [Solobacterium sp.]